MRSSGYKIYTKHEDTDKALDNVCNIAFQTGAWCGFHKEGNTEFYVWGKFSDMVRVYSALKRNGYKLEVKRDEE